MDPNNSSKSDNSVANDLTHITEEMYKKNYELSQTNKTLTLLRKIDEITLNSITDVMQVAKSIVDAVIENSDFVTASIYLSNSKLNSLEQIAFSHLDEQIQAKLNDVLPIYVTSMPFSSTNNLLVKALGTKRAYITNTLLDVFATFENKKNIDTFASILQIKSTVVYPLVIRGQCFGILIISLAQDEASIDIYSQDLIKRLSSVIGISLDNTLLYKSIEDANDRLKQLDKMKDEFVSLASHELRTPMTAIKSYLWMYLENKKNGSPSEKDTTYLEHALDATNRLINLVNDMLNVSRIEAGRYVIRQKEINLAKLAQDTFTELTPFASGQQITLHVDASGAENIQVMADPDKMKEVFINLAGNSIKFTPPGGSITVSFKIENDMIITNLTDTGKGMTKEDLDKLFQKFSSVGDSYLTKITMEGTGLGLYITKSIIEMHGGKIWVNSEIDKGSTFSFSLKIVKDQKTIEASTFPITNSVVSLVASA